MKILHMLPGLTRGGAEEQLIHLINHLPEHEHHVLYVYDGPLNGRLVEAKAHLHHISGLIFPYDPLFFFRLLRKIRLIQPDCIHALLWSSSCIARIVGFLYPIPVVCGMHARKIHDGMFRIWIQRLTTIQPHTYIAASKGIARDLTAYHRVNPARIALIENGIVIPDRVDKTNYQSETVSLLAIGRFVPFKNFETLLIIFKEVVTQRPHAHLHIVGWGPLENILKAQSKELGIEENVTFIVNQSAQPHLKTADIFVQPSWEEGLSIALLEALSYACAVVVSGKKHQHDIIQHTIHGEVIDPEDISAFTQAIITLIDNVNLRSAYAKAGRQLVETHFNIISVSQQYQEVFKKALAPCTGRNDH